VAILDFAGSAALASRTMAADYLSPISDKPGHEVQALGNASRVRTMTVHIVCLIDFSPYTALTLKCAILKAIRDILEVRQSLAQFLH